MNRKTLLRLLLIVLPFVFIAAAGGAEKLYKWVDAEGNLHFSDRPPEDSSPAEEIEVDAEISQERQRAGQQQLMETQSAMAQRLMEQRASAEEQSRMNAEQDRERFNNQVRCAEARGNLAVLQRQGPAFTVNAQGDREYVEDADRDQRIAQFRRQVNQYCQQDG
ncbi:MAG: DUF4124 domain-containing protein [Pseudomonadota bacterium]